MAARPYKRRRILIESFQYRLLVINLIYFVAILLIFAGTLFLPLILQLRSGSLSVMEQGEVAGLFLSLHARVWPAMFVAFVLMALHSVFVSHRIAGPLYRFRSIFKAIGEGNLSIRASLRKTDYLEKESQSLNEMIVSLRSKIQAIHAHHEEIQALVPALQKAISLGSAEDLPKHMAALQEQIDRLRAALGQFRLRPDDERGKGASPPATAAPMTSADSAPSSGA